MTEYILPLFSDGQKVIHFVLVYKNSDLEGNKLTILENFVKNLLVVGLSVEIEAFKVDSDINFIKIHASDHFVLRCASLCDIDLECREARHRPSSGTPPNIFATPLTKPNPRDEVYQRAPESISGAFSKTITSAERIQVLNRLMERVKYSNTRSDYGYQKLLKAKVLTDAFPLHDGSDEWTESGQLNDRQLLAKYWANLGCWYKTQPLNLIEKYYGSEYGFYFAWFGLYTKMLIPIGILSLMCIIYGLSTVASKLNTRSMEICNSDIVLCAKCHYVTLCHFEKLEEFCEISYFVYICDNPANIALAVIVAFWSTILLEMWKRKESELQIRWNVKSLEFADYMRPAYVERVKTMEYSTITKRNEPKFNRKRKVFNVIVTLTTMLLMVMIIIVGTVAVMAYCIGISFVMLRDIQTEFLKKYVSLIAAFTGSTLSFLVITIFKLGIDKLSFELTRMENHRTQIEFDDSFIWKHYALHFTNCYTVLFYIAFFKGRFFTHPGDMDQWTYLGGLGSDVCNVSGCISHLTVQLIVILAMKKLVINNVLQIVEPLVYLLKNLRKLKHTKPSELKRYEKEYMLSPSDKHMLINEYTDMIISHGYCIFFVACFPLAPILALINNIIELRIDASKITKIFRRPVPNTVSSLTPWSDILQVITYVGVITNGLIIALTSDFVPRKLYHDVNGNLSLGHTGLSISAFAMKDFQIFRSRLKDDVNVCYYSGMRYPPDHKLKYELTEDYWQIWTIRLSVLMIFVHIVFFVAGIIAYAIPDVPESVTRHIQLEEKKNRSKILRAAYRHNKHAPINKVKSSV